MTTLLHRLWSTLLRIALALFGLLMVVGVMAAGVTLGLVVIGWALLRGRRVPPVKFRWNGPLDWRQHGRRPASTASATADIVDIEARELDSPEISADQRQLQARDRRPD